MIQSPTYQDLVPPLTGDEVAERLHEQPFHIATFLHPSNIARLLRVGGYDDTWPAYLAQSSASRRSMLAELLEHIGIAPDIAALFRCVDRQQGMPETLEPLLYLLDGFAFGAEVQTTCPLLLATMLERTVTTAPHVQLGGVGSGYGLRLLRAHAPDAAIDAFDLNVQAIDRLRPLLDEAMSAAISLNGRSIWSIDSPSDHAVVLTFAIHRSRVDVLSTHANWVAPVTFGSATDLFADGESVLRGVRFVADLDADDA